MKLFIATCIKEKKADLAAIFKRAEVRMFSSVDITGFKENNKSDPLAEWFATGDETFDSFMMFSFTSAQCAQDALILIKEYNDTESRQFPIRAVIVPIEQAGF